VVWALLPAAAAAIGWEDLETELRPHVEQLYLNCRHLDGIYSDLHEAARQHGAGSDRELDYIQKAYLFVNEARQICWCNWKLFSTLTYLRDDRLEDYLRLRTQDLQDAIGDSAHTVRLIELYGEFIESAEVRRLITDAVGIIQGNIYLYEALLKATADPDEHSLRSSEKP
jgi:hypothetical protein